MLRLSGGFKLTLLELFFVSCFDNTGMPNAVVAVPSIVLCTLNAKYIHASLGLRYLLANMGELRASTVLREYTIARRPDEVVSELLAVLGEPSGGAVQILGLGVYIWNVTQSIELVRLLKAARPALRVVLGGPEVSHELDQQEIVQLADHVITGWGDLSFAKLCRALLDGPQPLMKVIAGEQPSLDQIALPYTEYSDADLAHRLLYVEASRGCPFKCEFCLSSLDKTAWSFDLDRFLAALDVLYQRGARHFKFVDRTFNLKIDASLRILQFFLDRLPPPGAPAAADALFLHFEVVPDHLPDRLKTMLAKFPSGVLQLEIGVQSFNPEVQQRISRQQDNDKTEANLRWLRTESQAHLHTDLIFGLPGEDLAEFAAGFDRLVRIGPQEIQLGILKRLRGAPISRHSADYQMQYDPRPPYCVLQTGAVDAATLQHFPHLARYWERIANSGRFKQTLALWLGQSASPFQAFLAFSHWLWHRAGTSCSLSPEALLDALSDYLRNEGGLSEASVKKSLLTDYLASGARGSPHALKGLLPKRPASNPAISKHLAQRQSQHSSA